MKTELPDLKFEIRDDGTVDLEQGWAEPTFVTIHSSQLRLIAEHAGLFNGTPHRMTGSIHRRLLELQSDLRYFTDHDLWLTEIAERLGDGLAFQIGASAMRSAIDGIIADLGLVPLDAEPEQEPAESPEPAQKSDDIYQQDLELGGAS